MKSNHVLSLVAISSLIALSGCAETKMIDSTIGQSTNNTMTDLSILYSKVFWYSNTSGSDVLFYKSKYQALFNIV